MGGTSELEDQLASWAIDALGANCTDTLEDVLNSKATTTTAKPTTTTITAKPTTTTTSAPAYESPAHTGPTSVEECSALYSCPSGSGLSLTYQGTTFDNRCRCCDANGVCSDTTPCNRSRPGLQICTHCESADHCELDGCADEVPAEVGKCTDTNCIVPNCGTCEFRAYDTCVVCSSGFDLSSTGSCVTSVSEVGSKALLTIMGPITALVVFLVLLAVLVLVFVLVFFCSYRPRKRCIAVLKAQDEARAVARSTRSRDRDGATKKKKRSHAVSALSGHRKRNQGGEGERDGFSDRSTASGARSSGTNGGSVEESLVRVKSARLQRTRSSRTGQRSTPFAEILDDNVTDIDDVMEFDDVSRGSATANCGPLLQYFLSLPVSSVSQEYQGAVCGSNPEPSLPSRVPWIAGARSRPDSNVSSHRDGSHQHPAGTGTDNLPNPLQSQASHASPGTSAGVDSSSLNVPWHSRLSVSCPGLDERTPLVESSCALVLLPGGDLLNSCFLMFRSS